MRRRAASTSTALEERRAARFLGGLAGSSPRLITVVGCGFRAAFFFGTAFGFALGFGLLFGVFATAPLPLLPDGTIIAANGKTGRGEEKSQVITNCDHLRNLKHF